MKFLDVKNKAMFGTPGKHHSVLKGITNPDDFDIPAIRRAETVPTDHSSKTPISEKLVWNCSSKNVHKSSHFLSAAISN
jgi:hypothetical protein